MIVYLEMTEDLKLSIVSVDLIPRYGKPIEVIDNECTWIEKTLQEYELVQQFLQEKDRNTSGQ